MLTLKIEQAGMGSEAREYLDNEVENILSSARRGDFGRKMNLRVLSITPIYDDKMQLDEWWVHFEEIRGG